MDTTQSIFKKGEEYCLERKQFHEQIIKINDNLKEGFRLHRELPRKHILILAGGSGAGKTTTLKRQPLANLYYCYNLLDADSVKEFLPEYYCSDENRRNAAIVHGESSDIVKQMIIDYSKEERCLVYDGTLKSLNKNLRIIESLKNAGYSIDILFVDCDLTLAYSRVKERASRTGRDVHANIIRDSNYLSAKTVYTLMESHFDLLNEVMIVASCYDESQGIDVIKEVYNKRSDSEYILNKELYEIFKTKALTKREEFVDMRDLIISLKEKGED